METTNKYKSYIYVAKKEAKSYIMVSAKRKQNHISTLQRSDGEFVDDQVELCGVVELYFDDLFTGSTGNISTP